MYLRTSLLALAVVLGGCSSPDEMDDALGQPNAAGAVATPSGSNSQGKSGAVAIAEETDLFSFEYAYPAQAAALAPLGAELARRQKDAKARLTSEAQTDQQGAQEAGFPYRKHSLAETWKVVADLPDFLSLTGEFSTYSGGAHGNHGMTSLVWDKKAAAPISGSDMFISPARLGSAVGDRFCAAIDRQRAHKRGPEAMADGRSSFTNCPAMSELTIIPGSRGGIPGSRDGTAFDRVGFYAGPYVAGPYAEGSYEVTLPVDAAMLAAVKPEYKSAFEVQR